MTNYLTRETWEGLLWPWVEGVKPTEVRESLLIGMGDFRSLCIRTQEAVSQECGRSARFLQLLRVGLLLTSLWNAFHTHTHPEMCVPGNSEGRHIDSQDELSSAFEALHQIRQVLSHCS